MAIVTTLHSNLSGGDLHDPKTHATTHKDGGADEITLDELDTAGNVDFGGYDIQAVEDITVTRMYGDMVFETPAANYGSSGITVYLYNGNAGAVAVGDVCYMAADGHLEFGDADAVTTAPALYMALGATGAAALGYWLMQGIVRNDSWNWTVGPGEAGLIYLSCTGTTGNTLTQTQPAGTGDQVQVIGHALSADVMMFDPSPVLVEVA